MHREPPWVQRHMAARVMRRDAIARSRIRAHFRLRAGEAGAFVDSAQWCPPTTWVHISKDDQWPFLRRTGPCDYTPDAPAPRLPASDASPAPAREADSTTEATSFYTAID